MLNEADGVARAVVWLVFFSVEHPGYGFVDAAIPELSITTFEGFRGQGVGSALLEHLIAAAPAKALPGISLSVEDGNRALVILAAGVSGGRSLRLLRHDAAAVAADGADRVAVVASTV